MKTTSKLLPVLFVCLCLTGCQALNAFKDMFNRKDIPPPQEWTGTAQPTLEQIISGINRNSQMIRNFTTDSASVSVPGGLIPLQSRLTFERPKRLRIQGAVFTLSGPEFDFGSNDVLFWLWTRRDTNVMWYCQHDQYHTSPLRSVFPFDPEWLIEALGIVEFKPTDQHFGPTRQTDGNWEIVSHCQTPSGQFIKRTLVDSKIGWVVQQKLYTPQEQLVAMSKATKLKFDKGTGIYYVKQVEVQCQGMTGTMTIDLGSPTFNTTASFAPSMFDMPVYEGYRAVDLCGPDVLQPHGVIMPPPQQMPHTPEASIQTVIR